MPRSTDSGSAPRRFTVRWRMTRWVLAMLSAAIVAVFLGAVAPAQVRAADPQLRLSAATTYRMDPARGAIHVTVDLTATSLLPNTSTRIYFYTGIGLVLQPEARTLRATSGGARLTIKSKARKGALDVQVKIPNLYFHRTRTIRLTYDLPSGKPRSASNVRVGLGHAEFLAWAFGDPGRADVTIISATGFEPTIAAQDPGAPIIGRTTVAGKVTFTARKIAHPDLWYAFVVADKSSGLTSAPLDLPAHKVTIHAWPEDKTWLTHVTAELKTGLPALEEEIGLPWPVPGDLGVTEVASSTIDGYAGLFDGDSIRITEDLDDQVIVHEASHAWFNADLFQERWIGEGLADEYASRVVAKTGGGASANPRPVSPTSAVAFKLNTWPPPTVIDDKNGPTEDYGYDASWTVIRQLVAEVGEAKMRRIFEAASVGRIAYLGKGAGEHLGINTWRTFLDDLDEIGGSRSADRLFRTWVVAPTDIAAMDQRDKARTTYTALESHGGDWLPGPIIRTWMARWNFNDAEKYMASAETVLDDRDALLTATAALGLSTSPIFETQYEAADTPGDLPALDATIGAWIAATQEVAAGRDALAAARTPLTTLGLLGSDTQPEAHYDAALAAFRAGDRGAATDDVHAAIAQLTGAEAIGRDRLVLAAAVSVAVVFLLLLLVALLWRRRRRRRMARLPGGSAALAWGPDMFAAPIVPSGEPVLAAATDGYATLAATPETGAVAHTGNDAERGGEGPD